MSIPTRPQAFRLTPEVDAALREVERAIAEQRELKMPRIIAVLTAARELCEDINADTMPQRAAVIRSRALAVEAMAERLKADLAPARNSELGRVVDTAIALGRDVNEGGDIHQRTEHDQVRLSLWAGTLESHIRHIAGMGAAAIFTPKDLA